MQSKSAGTLKGCDLSHHHADIKITSVSGDIVYLKATEGQHTKDPAFDNFYAQCKTAGKKIGAYHFLHIGGDYTVESQVENAAAAVNGKEIDCLFGIDIEDGGYHGGTPDEVTTQILRFADLFTAKTNIPCCVYASTAFIKAHFKPEIKRMPLWVAHYGVDTPGDNGIWDSWTGFQYTDKPYDLDVFMQDILINRETAANRIVKSVMPALASSDVYAVSSLPCDWNATAGANFDVRSSDGTAVSSRQIFKGDKIIILNVNFEKQLAEVLYPTRACWVHGWINNRQDLIHDRWHFKWCNGSTNETVYGSPSGSDKIGTIFPHEKATPLYKKGNRIALLYNTKKGNETKFGYVDYNGGFKF